MKKSTVALSIIVLLALATGYVLRNGWTHAVTSRLPKHKVACPTSGRVLIVGGQSLAANAGHVRTGGDGYAFDGQDCYPLIDPVAGGDGSGGSIWPEAVGMLPGPTIVVSGAMIGSSITEWTGRNAHGEPYADRLRRRYDALRGRGRYSFAFVFMQGESDAGTRMTADEYRRQLEMLYPKFADIPRWYVTRESRCFLGEVGWPPLDEARTAFAKAHPNVMIGAYLDDIGDDARVGDHCHLNGRGQHLFATRVGEGLRRLGW